MPRNVGKYDQGSSAPHAAQEPKTSETPRRAAPAGPVPRGKQPEREALKSTGNNDAHKP